MPRKPSRRASARQAGLTQTDLAERAVLSVTMVQNLERASYAGNPRLSLLALAGALGVRPAALLPGRPENVADADEDNEARPKASVPTYGPSCVPLG